jgi:uncharacterized protein YjbI with pentapeptide repeats
MPADPTDPGELQKALNDSAGKASALWTTLVIFELYLAIAFGSVTHRNLFLEDPIKLPLLNVDLPLVGFFVVAPTILVIFHFFVILQLLALADKAKSYDSLLKQQAPVAADREYLKHRLDSFLVVQFLAGPSEQRTGLRGLSLRLIAWLTLVSVPVLILLQGQLTFLPYHKEPVVWLHRAELTIDLAVIFYFWNRLRGNDLPILGRPLTKVWVVIGAVLTFGLVIFSVLIVTFPGEWAHRILADAADSQSKRAIKALLLPVHDLLFTGPAPVDEVGGPTTGVLANRIVLTDQSFVDPEKLDKVEVTRSFRDRDLRGAILSRADLRKSDFTGANLRSVNFNEANLQGARFDCRRSRNEMEDYPEDACANLQGAFLNGAKAQSASFVGARLQNAFLDGADLQNAQLNGAQLQEASLDKARLQNASLARADLSDASLNSTRLQGASLSHAKLHRAFFQGASLQGANLENAKMEGAWLDSANLQGAKLVSARLTAAGLNRANLQGADMELASLRAASLRYAELQGADLTAADLSGATMSRAQVWNVRGIPTVELTDSSGLNFSTVAWSGPSKFVVWRDTILDAIPAGIARDNASRRLDLLKPTSDKKRAFGEVLQVGFWTSNRFDSHSVEARSKLARFLANMVCKSDLPLIVLKGLNANGRLYDLGGQANEFVEQVRKGKTDLTLCRAVEQFSEEDWIKVDQWTSKVPTP